MLLPALALLLPGGARAQDAATPDAAPPDFHLSGTYGLEYSNGSYGTSRNTNVLIHLPSLSATSGDFRLTASMPYMRISGRGLVVFDASGTPIVINRRTNLPPDVRTGFSDLNLSLTYSIPSAVLDDFEVRITGTTKLPTASERRRLSTGKADFGVSVDISRQYGDWQPFLTVGYLVPGHSASFTLSDTTSVSVGTSLDLSDELVAVASYDFAGSSTSLLTASNELFGSLSWVRDDGFTLTGYGTLGLSNGSPGVGTGLLISYGLN